MNVFWGQQSVYTPNAYWVNIGSTQILEYYHYHYCIFQSISIPTVQWGIKVASGTWFLQSNCHCIVSFQESD